MLSELIYETMSVLDNACIQEHVQVVAANYCPDTSLCQSEPSSLVEKGVNLSGEYGGNWCPGRRATSIRCTAVINTETEVADNAKMEVWKQAKMATAGGRGKVKHGCYCCPKRVVLESEKTYARGTIMKHSTMMDSNTRTSNIVFLVFL